TGLVILDRRSGVEMRPRGNLGKFYREALSADGRQIALAMADRSVKLCDVTTGQTRDLAGAWGSDTNATPALAFSPDGRLFAVTAAKKTVQLWETATGRELFSLPAATRLTRWPASLVFSPDGTRLAAASFGSVPVWDTRTGRLTVTLAGHTGS